MLCNLCLISSSDIPFALYTWIALSLALTIPNSGSLISCILSFHREAIRLFKGSALGEGMDWIMRKMVSVFPASDEYLLPSADKNFSWLQIVTDSLHSCFNLNFRTFR